MELDKPVGDSQVGAASDTVRAAEETPQLPSHIPCLTMNQVNSEKKTGQLKQSIHSPQLVNLVVANEESF